MEPFSIGAAIISGLVATAVMTGALYLLRSLIPDHVPLNILEMMGTMVTRDPSRAYLLGGVMHFVVGTVLGIVHVLIYLAFGITSMLYLWGILLGGVHWLVAGIGMGMMEKVHPMIQNDEMTAPGLFVRNLPMMTVVGFLLLHFVFGIVNGAVYQVLRGVF